MRKPQNTELNGILNIYKKKGFTSHDVVAIIRGVTGAKTGHTGTLDPNAEGVLPVCLGKATRLSDYIMHSDKEYIADVILGIKTDTEDITGTVLAEQAVSLGINEINAAVSSFVGEYDQVPPMYSAIKINGKKLYEIARTGAEVERKSRRVSLLALEILEYNLPGGFKLRVNCSSGAYVRSLCRDIGEKLGIPACMGELLRTRVGKYRLENAYELDEIKQFAADGTLKDKLILPQDALSEYPQVYIKPEFEKALINGNPLKEESVAGGFPEESSKVLVFNSEGKLAGVYEVKSAGGSRALKAKTVL